MSVIRGRAIRKAYEDMGLSRAEFAQQTRIPAKTITNITSCEQARVHRSRAVRIAEALGWELDSLMVEGAQEADVSA